MVSTPTSIGFDAFEPFEAAETRHRPLASRSTLVTAVLVWILGFFGPGGSWWNSLAIRWYMRCTPPTVWKTVGVKSLRPSERKPMFEK